MVVVGGGGAALSLPSQMTSFNHFCRETCLSPYFALGQGPVPIASLWRLKDPFSPFKGLSQHPGRLGMALAGD